MIYCEDCSSYDCGCPERNETESLRQQLAAMTAERDKAKAMPMRYRRMEFNAQLQNEIESLRQQLILKEHQYDVMKVSAEVLAEQCEKMRQQLAAALAAIKSKDAALQSAISAHRYESGDLHDALAIQPDDSALKAWLGEPVAYLFQHEDTGRTMCVEAQQLEWNFEKNNPRLFNCGPLYSPKGMTK